MIDYSPFWNTLECSDENWYTLTNKHNMSHSTLHRLKHNKDISKATLEVLKKFASRVENFAVVEQKAKLEGRNMTMLLAPNTSK